MAGIDLSFLDTGKTTTPEGTDMTTDQIVRAVLDFARQQWPEQTAEFQGWVDRTLSSYGISYAKYRATQLATDYKTPLLVLGGALAAWLLLRK
jgi:hypothetical protein